MAATRFLSTSKDPAGDLQLVIGRPAERGVSAPPMGDSHMPAVVAALRAAVAKPPAGVPVSPDGRLPIIVNICGSRDGRNHVTGKGIAVVMRALVEADARLDVRMLRCAAARAAPLWVSVWWWWWREARVDCVCCVCAHARARARACLCTCVRTGVCVVCVWLVCLPV